MEEILITADSRKGKGKSTTRKLRKQGIIPAILYGKDTESMLITISSKDWQKLSRHMKRNAILTMQLRKNGETQKLPVMVKDIQREPYGDSILHIDFLHVSMERKVEVEIPIHLTGEAKGLINNGIIEQHLRTIMVECLPTQIPEKIDVDITELDIGDSVHINEISYPGIRFLGNPEVAIVTIIPPETEEKVVVEEPVEAEKKEE